MSVPPNVVRRGDGLPLVAVHGNGVDRRLLLALDGAGHNVHLEQPDVVHALLREWSGRVRSTIGGDRGGVRSDV